MNEPFKSLLTDYFKLLKKRKKYLQESIRGLEFKIPDLDKLMRDIHYIVAYLLQKENFDFKTKIMKDDGTFDRIIIQDNLVRVRRYRRHSYRYLDLIDGIGNYYSVSNRENHIISILPNRIKEDILKINQMLSEYKKMYDLSENANSEITNLNVNLKLEYIDIFEDEVLEKQVIKISIDDLRNPSRFVGDDEYYKSCLTLIENYAKFIHQTHKEYETLIINIDKIRDGYNDILLLRDI